MKTVTDGETQANARDAKLALGMGHTAYLKGTDTFKDQYCRYRYF